MATKRSTRARRPPKSPDAVPHRESSTAAAPPPWLADLRVQLGDIVAAALDATDAPSKRVLGRSEARRQILAAANKCEAIFALAGKGAAAP